MQLFSADATIFFFFFANENMKKLPLEVAHNRPKTSPNLNFCSIKIVYRMTYV
jgi:hypothetical protein